MCVVFIEALRELKETNIGFKINNIFDYFNGKNERIKLNEILADTNKTFFSHKHHLHNAVEDR